MSRFLKGTIHLLNDDGSLNSVLRGTPEAAAKKQAPEAYKTWGDHVWVDQPDEEPEDSSSPPAKRQGPKKAAGGKKDGDGDGDPGGDGPEGDGE